MLDTNALLPLFGPAAPVSTSLYATIPLWFFLGGAAFIDLRRGRVPNLFLAPAFAYALFLSYTFETHTLFAARLLLSLISYAVLWAVNELFFMIFRRDAYGMGDAKWTAATIAGFGLLATFDAWIYGAWFALIWMGARLLIGLFVPAYKRRGYVHFVPFLFAGLITHTQGVHLF